MRKVFYVGFRIMNRCFLLSLWAVAPLLLRSEEMIDMFENADEEDCAYESCEAFEDSDEPIRPLVVEIQETHRENVEQESFSLEIFDLADVQMQSNDTVAEAQIEPDAPVQESQEDLADGQEPKILEEVPSKNRTCPDETMCMPDIEPYQINARHTESKGIGYSKGYTTLEGLFTFPKGKYIPFLDLRGHVFDNGRLAANAGIGTRYIWDSSKSMVGINTYYDYRNLKNAHFNQWGLGLEGFYKRWELRINGYLPVGKKSIVADHKLNWISFKKFQGNNLWINENYTDKVISAKKGFNLEGAVHPFNITRDFDLIVAAGPYYFGGEGKSSWGVKARLKAEIAKYFFVELSDSYDHVFHNRFQGTVMLSLPFGGKKCYPRKTRNTEESDCFADNIMVWRGVQPVERQEIIVAKKETKTYTIDPIAINPATKQPIKIVFVNNQPTLSGDGTFENPYNALATAQANTTAGDNIYVFAGDGTTTNYNTGWTIQNDQRFLGSAAAHAFSTTKGMVTVPIQTNIFPQITNTGGANVIQTPTGVGAANFEISGIEAIATTATTNPNSVLFLEGKNMTIANNFINGNTLVGDFASIAAIRASGDLLIDSNIIQNGGDNLATGLNIVKDGTYAPANTFNAVVTNNQINLCGRGAMAVSTDNNALGEQNLTITGNIFSDTATFPGVYFFEDGTARVVTRATINSNLMFNNVSDFGLHVQQLAVGSSGFYNVFDNIFTNNRGAGFEVADGASMCISLHDNVAHLNGYMIQAAVNSTCFLEPFFNNIGTTNFSGPIVPVAPCFCQFCGLPDND